jgi:uncharacterized membrane protein
MAEIEKTIVVAVPRHEVYNQWTQFEEFPEFMEGIVEVRQLDDKTLYWRANVAGAEREWHAKIVEQVPDECVVWRNVTGVENSGAVFFRELADGHTEVLLRVHYEPEGMTENVGEALGLVSRRVEGDLKRFRQFIENRGRATGGWRGEIHGETVRNQ